MKNLPNHLVSVIIPTYKREDLLSRCLESLGSQTYKDIEVIVVVNSSSQNKIRTLITINPDVKFVCNPNNEFYCKANNQGIALSKGEFILCLNDDAVLKDNFIEEMLKPALGDDRIGLVSGCILRQDGVTVDTTGQFLAKSRRPQERGYGKRYNSSFGIAGYIFGAAGVAPLYRRKMLENIKLDGEYFDEDYGMYYEDLDISWRAHNKGWRCYYAPEAVAYHFRGASSKQNEPRWPFLKRYSLSFLPRQLKLFLIKNRYSTIIKNDRLKDFLKNLPWILGYEIKLWPYVFMFEPALIKDFFKDLKFIKSAYKKRKRIRLHEEA